ncbi:MAG: GCN5-related N-acetyltransferase protein [Glaciihabitans sp.]|nr:GCN5-related N-acetyltransferase protein [Glaciihabitans sp.]
MNENARPTLPAAVIRPATAVDLPTVVRIRNNAVEHSTALWTHQLVDLSTVTGWLGDAATAGHAFLVAEVDGVPVGYATYGRWRPYSGFRHTVDDSIYIEDGHHGRGIGIGLLSELITHARQAGYHLMVADIEAGNTASIALHRKVGFEVSGTVPQVGTKFGRWLDLTIMSLQLEEDAPPRD